MMKTAPSSPESSSRRAVFSWCLYDWANSAYSTTVLAALFPIYFKSFWNQDVAGTISTARLGWGNGIAGLCVAFSAPFVGAWADATGMRRRLLGIFAYTGALMTFVLSRIEAGQWMWALAVFAIATIGFSLGNCLYDSLLPVLVPRGRLDQVSSWGYAAGYCGGGIVFAFDIAIILKPRLFGLVDRVAAVQWAFVSVALWWGVFTLPVLLFAREPSGLRGAAGKFRQSIRALLSTARTIATTPVLRYFLLGYWLYIDGVHTFVRMSVDFGMSIGLESGALMGALLMVQFIAFPAALAFAWCAGRIGPYRSILVGIAAYCAITLWAAASIRTVVHFYIAAGGVALVQGGVQALSRSYFARLFDARRGGEFFGFYNLVGKFAVIVGPVMVGTVAWGLERAGCPPFAASRWAVATIALLFISGGMFLVMAERNRNAFD